MQQGWYVGEQLTALLRENIEMLRRKSGMHGDHAQAMLATITGISRGTINAYCNSRRRLGSKNAPAIAKALDMDLSDLLEALGAVEGQERRRETDALIEQLQAMIEGDFALEGVGAILRLLARRLDAIEQAVAVPSQRAG